MNFDTAICLFKKAAVYTFYNTCPDYLKELAKQRASDFIYDLDGKLSKKWLLEEGHIEEGDDWKRVFFEEYYEDFTIARYKTYEELSVIALTIMEIWDLFEWDFLEYDVLLEFVLQKLLITYFEILPE